MMRSTESRFDGREGRLRVRMNSETIDNAYSMDPMVAIVAGVKLSMKQG